MSHSADITRDERFLTLLDQLLELDPDQRQAALAAMRAERPTVVDDLQLYLQLPPETDDRRTLGRYPVTSVLGEGGMGQVLQVLDPDLLREVAAKVIVGGCSPEHETRFLREARITGQLEHPNIVPLHELGRTPDGTLYFTMKRVEGGTLTALLRDEQVSTLERLHIFLKVCDAIAFAHANDVIHRDLKPDNVMVGSFGEVLVCDWGVAKVLGEPDDAADAVVPDRRVSTGDDELRTLSGAVVGTPAYMPPEQAQGHVEALDTRSDIYALGAILYQILTGHPPFEGPTVWAVLASVVGDDPIPPTRIDPRIPTELAAATLRAMAKDPDRRYPTVEALAADIRAYLEGRELTAVDYTPSQRALKFLRRHWRLASATAAIVASIIGALAYGFTRERAERARTESARAKAVASQRLAAARAREARRERAAALANLAKAKQLGALEAVSILRRRFVHDLHWTPLARNGDQLQGGLRHPPTRSRLTVAIEEIAAWDAAAQALLDRRPIFERALMVVGRPDEASSDTERDWRSLQLQTYGQILEGLDALKTLKRRASQRRRTYQARLDRAVDPRSWRAAAARIAANPRYRAGLRPGQRAELRPQVDLVPLGPDPLTTLEEFAHRGSGVLPLRSRGGRLTLADDSAIVFVLIPGGEYWIGASQPQSPDEAPRHRVTLDAFLIGKTELTQAQWVALGARNTSTWRAGRQAGPRVLTARHPVEQVSWRECVEQLGERGLVLPTERQWEAAARGGTRSPWWTGSHPVTLANAENVADALARRAITNLVGAEAHSDGHWVTAPAGSYPRVHPFGLADVVGNVREWCRDVFDEHAYRRQEGRLDRQGWLPPTDHAEVRHRAVRGGCWTYRATFGRSAKRLGIPPAFRDGSVGCRPSRALTHTP